LAHRAYTRLITSVKTYPFDSAFGVCLVAYTELLIRLASHCETTVFGDLIADYIPAAQAFLEGDWSAGGHILGLGPTHPLLRVPNHMGGDP